VLTNERQRYDFDGNGAISIEELYRALKAKVVEESGGAQVPSLARNLLVGDIDLF
jgi:Ca2+-binding EF-hand superfamily protein